MCELSKNIETVLNGTKNPNGIAIKLLAKLVDNKFSYFDKENKRLHDETIAEIKKINEETKNLKHDIDEKFMNIEVVSFFSKHKKIFLFIVISCVFMAGAGLEKFLNLILKLF